jgi:energy-coupling factor transport system permease protein
VGSLFKYTYRDTPIHKLNPVARVVLFGGFMFIPSMVVDPRVEVPLTILLLVILRLAEVPLKPYAGLLAIALLGGIVRGSLYASQMADPRFFKVYSQEWAGRVILSLTPAGTPILGRTAVTPGTLLFLFASAYRAIPMVLTMAGFLYTTSTNDMVSMLSRLRAPFPVIFMMTVALRWVPDLVLKMEMIRQAQSLRGWAYEGRNPIRKVASLRVVLVPLLRYVVQSVDIVTVAAKNRAFGLGPVTLLADFGYTQADRMVCIAVAVSVAAFTVASLFWHFGAL